MSTYQMLIEKSRKETWTEAEKLIQDAEARAEQERARAEQEKLAAAAKMKKTVSIMPRSLTSCLFRWMSWKNCKATLRISTVLPLLDRILLVDRVVNLPERNLFRPENKSQPVQMKKENLFLYYEFIAILCNINNYIKTTKGVMREIKLNQSIFIDLTSDFGFKKLFGSDPNKDLLISFLNGVLAGRKQIVDLEFASNEHLGDGPEEGGAIFDLHCTGSGGEKFIVEVQRAKQKNFRKRAVFYTSRLISKQENELENDLDRWLFALKNMAKLKKIPVYLRKTIFEKVFKIAAYSKLNQEERMAYDASLKRKWDEFSIKETAFEEGFDKGKLEGKLEGAEEQSRAIAREMLKKGLSIDLIAETTGLSPKEIEEL